MFRILDRYLVSEVFFPFMIMMIGAVVFGLTDLIYTLTDLFINSGVPLAVVVRLLLFKIPAVMVLYFPLVILFATLLVMVRMARESEITVLQAGGISSLRIVLGLILFGALATGVSYFLNETVVPMSNHVSDNLIRKAGLKKPPPEITQNVFFKASRNRYFYIRSISPSFKVMNDVMVYELTADFPRVITAKEEHRAHRERDPGQPHLVVDAEFLRERLAPVENDITLRRSHADEDKKKREAIDARNTLDSSVYQAEKMKSDNKDKIAEDDVKKIDEGIEAAKKVLADEKADKDTLEAAAKALTDVLMPIGAKLYEDASKEAPADEAESAKKADDGPVEGEVVDDKK
jgi:lipopolysaccharide export LptBFGC system permease protein LptF